MTKKQGIRALLFGAVLAGVLIWIGTVLGMPKDDDVILMTRRFEELYSEPKDTWDGVMIGTSVADRAWAAPAAWEEYGMAVYPMSTDGQPFVLSVNLLEEIRKYQDISFAVIDLHGIRRASLKTNGGRIRWITDHMRPSLLRLQTVKKALDYMDEWYPGAFDESIISRLSYYIPFLKFHLRLTADEFYEGDFTTGETRMKGVYEAERHVAVKSVELTPTDTVRELEELQIQLLDELTEYAGETGLTLIFVKTPSSFSEKILADMNGAAAWLEEKGYPVVNFNDAELLEAVGVDGNGDFIDEKHLNTRGARKFTEYFAAYLHEALELTDHRGDETYESWDEAASVYEDFYRDSLEKIAREQEKNSQE